MCQDIIIFYCFVLLHSSQYFSLPQKCCRLFFFVKFHYIASNLNCYSLKPPSEAWETPCTPVSQGRKTQGTISTVSFPEPALPLSSGTGNERFPFSFPIPLDKGNAGSGNEMAISNDNYIMCHFLYQVSNEVLIGGYFINN